MVFVGSMNATEPLPQIVVTMPRWMTLVLSFPSKAEPISLIPWKPTGPIWAVILISCGRTNGPSTDPAPTQSSLIATGVLIAMKSWWAIGLRLLWTCSKLVLHTRPWLIKALFPVVHILKSKSMLPFSQFMVEWLQLLPAEMETNGLRFTIIIILRAMLSMANILPLKPVSFHSFFLFLCYSTWLLMACVTLTISLVKLSRHSPLP